MFRRMALGTAVFFAGSFSVLAAPKDDVQAAAKKLGDTSYSWKQTTENAGGLGRGGQGGQGRGGRGGFGMGGNLEGKTEKGGFTQITRTVQDNTMSAYIKDGKGAVQTQDGWQGLADLANAEGPQRFMATMYANLQLPAAVAADLATKAGELKAEGDMVSGDLTADGAKSLLTLGGGRGGRSGQANANFTPPEIKDPKGTVKFWHKDGVITKYQYNVKGSMTVQDQERAIDRTTTVEIKDIGATKVEVPADAKGKVS